ncbi:hypothetical protein [Mycetocola lacteus]|uniref:hypothetical protein n=1 Tax=Mycetocola lacteus TaxID=76637 RepID=UPI0011C440E7|nr:hypothetical protein [Mycetocola lacteus]
MSENLATQNPRVSETASAFAKLGWAFYGNWHYEESKRLLRLIQQGAPDGEIDREISEVWNGQQTALLKHVAGPLGRYGRGIDMEFQRRCQQRQTLINEAVDCHFDGRYAACITLVLAQIDGLTRELVGTSFFRSKPGEKDHDYTDDSTLAGVEGNLPVVRQAFSEPVPVVGRYGLVSRHGVMHGQDLSYANRVNSTKTLVLVGALVEHLAARAAKRAEKWRSQRDIRKSKLRGADMTGRLLDDRGFEELYMFRADFEGFAFNAIIFDQSLSRPVLELKAIELMDERRLPRRGFRLHYVESNRLMWSYRTQGGHYLGSAMSIKDINVRPVVQEQWTWDSANVPDESPWDAETGWSRCQNEPATPNWAFAGFYNG